MKMKKKIFIELSKKSDTKFKVFCMNYDYFRDTNQHTWIILWFFDWNLLTSPQRQLILIKQNTNYEQNKFSLWYKWYQWKGGS